MTDLHYFSFPIIDKNNISDSIFYCLTYNKIIENIIVDNNITFTLFWEKHRAIFFRRIMTDYLPHILISYVVFPLIYPKKLYFQSFQLFSQTRLKYYLF